MADAEEGPVIRFRNYQPRSDELQGMAIEKATVPAAVVEEAAIVHTDATQEPLLNLAPKRPNWDLKRDLEPQMKRLRSMTDRAIVQLIAERCAAEAEGDDAPDLAAAVERRQKVEAADDDE